jgi:acyl carrier protein
MQLNQELLFSEQKILNDLVKILQDMTADWDNDFSGSIDSETKLIEELGFESIDIVQFIVAVEEHFQRRGLPWEEVFMLDGRYVDEIKVGDTLQLLFSHLNNT